MWVRIDDRLLAEVNSGTRITDSHAGDGKAHVDLSYPEHRGQLRLASDVSCEGARRFIDHLGSKLEALDLRALVIEVEADVKAEALAKAEEAARAEANAKLPVKA